MSREVDVAIIGAGTAGLYALRAVREATENFLLIDGGKLGTTCARAGCMPSKAAIQVAEDFHRRGMLDRYGVQGGESLSVDVADALRHVRELRDLFVGRVVAGQQERTGDRFVRGMARFVAPTVLEVDGQTITARKVIIASGSHAYIPKEWQAFRDRILTTEEIFEQQMLPDSLAAIGLGAVGLELGQALSRMGLAVTGIDKAKTVAGLQDPVVNQKAIDIMGQEFPLWLGNSAELREEGGKLRVIAGERSVVVDKALVSMGRVPSVDALGLDALGVPLDARGVPTYDPHTMQIADLPVFITGDAAGHRQLQHEAADDGRIAGYNAVHEPATAFKRKTPLAITFCDPNIATVGRAFSELDPRGTAIGQVDLAPSGRAIVMGKNKGVVRVYADKSSGRLLGGAMISPKGENLAHLLAWSIEQDLTAFDLLKMPFYHPVIEETLQAAIYSVVKELDAPRARGKLLELRASA